MWGGVPLLARLKAAAYALMAPRPLARPVTMALPLYSYSARRGVGGVLRAYRENAWIRLVAETVAWQVAGVRWRVYKPRPSPLALVAARSIQGMGGQVRAKALQEAVQAGELIEVPGHEVLRILARPHPDPTYAGTQYRAAMQLYLDLAGEAFLHWLPGMDGRPAGFELIPPQHVTMTPTPERPNFWVHYQRLVGEVPRAAMGWVKHLDLEDPIGRGTGRGGTASDEVDFLDDFAKARRATYARGGVPAAIVSVDTKDPDSGEDREAYVKELRHDYEARFNTGPNDSGKVWFVPGSVSMAEVRVNYQQLQAAELEKSARDVIRALWNVSPELVGQMEDASATTAEEAHYILAQYAVRPRAEFQCEALQSQLVPLVDPTAVLAFDDPTPQTFERKLRVMTAAPNAGFTWNEVRALGGYAADPELEGQRPMPLPGAQPVQDKPPEEARNPAPARGPGRDEITGAKVEEPES